VEHVERQDEREQEIKGDLDDLDQQAEQMEEHRGELDEKIDEARDDFETKQDSGAIADGEPPA
jgi:F0F1-type ATP synthase membrane subunit b/b'